MSDNVTIVVQEPDTLAVSIAVIEPPTVVVPITVLSGAKGDKGDPGQDGIIGADGADGPPGADGAQGPAGPAPSGTGIVSVLDGVLQTPATVASFIAADPEGAAIALDLGGAAFLDVGTSNNTVAAGDAAPNTHAASHAAAGSDPVTLATSQVTGLDSALSGKEPSLPTGADSALLRDGAGAWILKTLAQFKTWLGLGSAAYENTGAFDSAGAASAAQAAAVQRANHTGTQTLSTISDAGNAASKNVGTASGTVAAGDDSRITGAAQKASNLSDLASAATARTNLGLGTLATQNGTFSGTHSGTSSGTNTGDQTNISGNAATVTTNANLTGPVTSVGNATAITDAAVTLAKMANLAQDTLIGRQTASTGVPEAITCTAAGRALIDDTTATAQRTTLGVIQGPLSIYVGAAEMIPRTTTGCGVNSVESSTNKVNYDVLEFDAATAEYAQFWRVMPTNWDGGTVTAKFHWTASSGSGEVVFGLQARCFADTNTIDQALGTAQTATDTLTSGGLGISPATSAITIAGSPATGRPILWQIYRDATAGTDTLAVDAQLLGIEITYTATA